MGLKFEEVPSPIKVQSLNERPRADEPVYNGGARSHGGIGQCRGQPLPPQLSCSADTKSETNTSSSSSSTKTVSLLDRLRAPTPSTLVRKRKISVNSAPPLGRNGRRDRKKRFITRIIGDHFGN